MELELGIAIADLRIPRMNPCSAVVSQFGLLCGASPASLYRRSCGVESHTGNIWLCPVHAMMVVSGGTICKLCAERGGIVAVASIERLTEPVRLLWPLLTFLR